MERELYEALKRNGINRTLIASALSAVREERDRVWAEAVSAGPFHYGVCECALCAPLRSLLEGSKPAAAAPTAEEGEG